MGNSGMPQMWSLTEHAKERIEQRRIPLELVEETLTMPDKYTMTQDGSGRCVLLRDIQFRGKPMTLRLVCAFTEEGGVTMTKVVTVYVAERGRY